MNEEQLNRLTERIIGCAFTVSNTLGCGFLEKVYENALVIELRNNGLHVQQQHPIKIHYAGVLVGVYLWPITSSVVDNFDTGRATDEHR